MQPTLFITVPAPGMIYINGRFCGEAMPSAPLFAPVCAFGACFLEYRPLEPGLMPMARRITMSGGWPLPESIAEDVFAIRWPGGITEIELSPEEFRRETIESMILDDVSIRIIRSDRSRIEIGGLTCAVPRTIHALELRRINGCLALMGDCDAGRCILTLSADFARQTGFLQADHLAFESTDVLRATLSKNDVAGHGTLERWRLSETGLQQLSIESIWIDGAPRAPASPEETARAAIEASLLGLFDEAEGYLSPTLCAQHPLDAVRAAGTLCLPMKYGIPGDRPCVGLMQVESGSCAIVHPVFYRAEESDGRWLLTELSLDSVANL